ncbi:MAG: Asp-tRNA(Asn)/Glu-tRNA(Gln) amidotransferase subunit GatB [Pseudomonadota bacterium]
MSASGWEAVIGLECHVQLMTRSKMFSGAPTAYGAEPNSQACAVDVALPGTLPVPNAEAVRMAARFGLAVGARVHGVSVFARKNYFYPDLPKGYQISQYEEPIVEGGTVHVRCDDGRTLDVPLVRAHLEEDAGKSVHDAFHGATGIDLNRAGTPLLEVVTEPALRSAADAAACMKALHHLVVWLGVCDGNLQEGSFRCDANVSVRRVGDPRLGTRTEIKNVNSFRFVEKAVEYEIERQVRELEAGRAIVQETRLYDETRHQTRSMRGKESAHDYRYFPDPDLPPLVLPEGLLETERAALPELPGARRARYESALGLSAYDAEQLTAARGTADFFEAVLDALPGQAKLVATWVLGELAAALNVGGFAHGAGPVSPAALAGLLGRIVDGTLSGKLAKDVFAAMWAGEGDADAVIAARGLGQISDDGALVAAIDAVLADHPKQAEQFRTGDEKVFTWLVGQVMKATRGKANPARLNDLLRRRLMD